MDDRYGDDRGGWRDGDRERGRYGRDWDRDDDRERGWDRGRDDDDRGFLDRAGDEVRSWFGDEEAERRRERDARRWESEQGYGRGRSRGNRDDDYHAGYRGTGGGWGNQSADSWNRDHPGESERMSRRNFMGGSDYDRDPGRGGDRPYGAFSSGNGGGGDMADSWAGSGFGGPDDNGRRFDRIDAGHTGTQGAHPMSSPVGGAYSAGGGIMPSGGYRGSSGSRYARARRAMESGGMAGGGYGQGRTRDWGGRDRDHDPHYSEWRRRQIESLDRDYDEYRREHQSKFEQDFGNWRARRTEQRQSLNRVTEHMEVVGSDGEHIGTVDKVRGDRIILTKSDPNAGGHHHSIPCSWIDKVEDKVTVNKTRDEAMRAWRDEEDNRALFERDDREGDGPHILNRSFSGTY